MSKARKKKSVYFSSKMVLDTLAGDKTSFRVPIPDNWEAISTKAEALQMCQYGPIGSHLWVRETYFVSWSGIISYRASSPDIGCTKWKSPATMPRKLSRITLQITDIKVLCEKGIPYSYLVSYRVVKPFKK